MITRFAPAPTGFLHLGHVVNAIYVWGMARAAGGRVLLRIEDHDRQRSRPDYERAMLEDLEWLGFVPDAPPVRQSDRNAVYQEALADLRASGLVYACECTRHDLTAPPEAGGELRYPGTCAGKTLTERDGIGMRVRLSPSIERFEDGRLGWQEQRPSEQCGDLLVRDRVGNWTYQFAAAVDDDRQGVTLVIRGEDLLASTGRQIQLARLLGRKEPPRFFHHQLLMKTSASAKATADKPAGSAKATADKPAQKLSKSDGDTGVRDLRARGWTAARVIGHAAARAGLLNIERPLEAEQLDELQLM